MVNVKQISLTHILATYESLLLLRLKIKKAKGNKGGRTTGFESDLEGEEWEIRGAALEGRVEGKYTEEKSGRSWWKKKKRKKEEYKPNFYSKFSNFTPEDDGNNDKKVANRIKLH